MKKILFVFTNNENLGETGNKTGFWLEEFTEPYYTLKEHNVEITFASAKGGQPPIDPDSRAEGASTPSTLRYVQDIETKKLLNTTLKLSELEHKDYDAIFYPGGHGLLWDLVENKESIRLIEGFYKHNKPVAFVCHGPAVLKNTKDAEGNPLVKDKKVTGFSNAEEEAMSLKDVVPFLLEDMLKEKGGKYSKGENWQPYAVEDQNLITGQNPASSKLVAEILLEKLVPKRTEKKIRER